MNRFTIRVCTVVAGFALLALMAVTAGPVARADGKDGVQPDAFGDSHFYLAQHEQGSGKKHHQGNYQRPHGKKGKKGRQGRRMGPMGHRRQTLMRRTIRLVVPKLSAEQQQQVRTLRLKRRRQMITIQAQLRNFRLDTRETLRGFPVDPNAIKPIFDKMANLRWQLWSLRLSALAEIQEMAGKKLWDEARADAMKKRGRGARHRRG